MHTDLCLTAAAEDANASMENDRSASRRRIQWAVFAGSVRPWANKNKGISWIPNLASARRALLDYVISV